MAINERRTEWPDPYGNGSVGYSRPVTGKEHEARVARFRALGQWGSAPRHRVDNLVASLPTSGQYLYASLVLEDKTPGQIRVALKQAGF